MPIRYMAILFLSLMLGACASGTSTRQVAKASPEDMCKPGENLICEVSNTGRISHGSFSKRNSRCACEVARAGATVIPSVGQ